MSEEERVRLIAYRLWEEEGRPDGRALDHWVRAEEELRADQSEFEHHLLKDVEGCALCT